MTRLHPKRLLFTLLFLSIYACVHEESVTDVLSEKGLSVETAHSLHDAALAKVKTKTSAIQERVNMFYRESYQPVWEKALYSSTSEVESVDVPVDEQRKYYVTSLDGQGYYLTRCHHYLTIVRSLETGDIGVYHHFFIPFRSTNETYHESHDEDFYGGFHNNSSRSNFTGLELYSDTNGNIIKLLRYARGELYESLYYGDGAVSRELMGYIIRHYIHKAYAVKSNVTTKGGHSHFLCPECGCELRVTEFGIYYCAKCPWNELLFQNQELDELYFYGDSGGGGGGSGYLPDDPNPDQPDPNTGGSGGGGASGDGNGSGIPSKYKWADNDEQKIKPVLEKLLKDCAGASLINAVASGNKDTIKFVSRNMIPMAMMKPEPHQYTIYHCVSDAIPEHVLFEELYHALQHVGNNYSKDWFLNLEAEAKYATYLYLEKNGSLDEMNGSNFEKQCFADYKENPSETNYLRILDYVRNQPGIIDYYGTMKEDSTKRSMPELFIFDCYAK